MGRTWLTASLILVVMAEGSLAGVLAADTGDEASARPSEAPAPMSSGAEVPGPVEADSGVAADTGAAEDPTDRRLQSEDVEVDAGRLDAARRAAALYLMALILVLVVIFVLVLTVGRRLVFQRGKPLRPTRLEDLWWKMNADVGPFPKDAAGTTEPAEEDDRTGDVADDE